MSSRSVYLTTLFPRQAMSFKQLTRTYADSFARNWQLPFLNQWNGENDRRKYFMIYLHKRMLLVPGGDRIHNPLITSWTCIQLRHTGWQMGPFIWGLVTKWHILLTDSINPPCYHWSRKWYSLLTDCVSPPCYWWSRKGSKNIICWCELG